MSEFDSREKAFEKKFEIDEEIKFKIASRAAHLVGLWAAEQMGLKGAEAESYAGQAVDIAAGKTGRADLAKRIGQDMQAKGQTVSAHRIEMQIENFYLKAREQIAGTAQS